MTPHIPARFDYAHKHRFYAKAIKTWRPKKQATASQTLLTGPEEAPLLLHWPAMEAAAPWPAGSVCSLLPQLTYGARKISSLSWSKTTTGCVSEGMFRILELHAQVLVRVRVRVGARGLP